MEATDSACAAESLSGPSAVCVAINVSSTVPSHNPHAWIMSTQVQSSIRCAKGRAGVSLNPQEADVAHIGVFEELMDKMSSQESDDPSFPCA